MDPISISAIVISIISALGAFFSRFRFKHCHCGCIDSDCIRTPSNTPTNTPPTTPKTSTNDEIYCNTSDYV